MDGTDGSSNAAHGAPATQHLNGNHPDRPGVWSRIRAVWNPAMIDDASDAGSTGEAAQPRMHGLANLRRMRVEDVAIPKADIVAVPVTADDAELAEVFRDSGLSRLPVFDGTLDTPVGMAHLKDFALEHALAHSDKTFDLHKMLRPLLYVPPSMPIGVLLTKMQTERMHMALVIDEYGGVDGLVTIEDLIEQVVGEIEDEHDTDEGRYWTRERTGCYLALSKTPLTDFEAELGLALTDHDDIDAEEIDTLGGLVFMLAGRVPARGEVVPHPAGIDFEVVEADPRRIKRLRVRPPGARKPISAADASALSKGSEAGHG